MQLQFVGRNLALTPALKAFATEKLKPLEKRYSHITQVNIVFHIEHTDQVAEATVHFHGAEIHAVAKSNDMYHSIDALIDKLMGQIHKAKEKMTEHR